MNSVDTIGTKGDDGRMNERVGKLEDIAAETALRLGSLERDLATLTTNVATLTESITTLGTNVAVMQATYVTKEEFQKGLHVMTWKIIGVIALLTAAVSCLSRSNAAPPLQASAAVAVTPTAPAQVTKE